ncbi:MAG: Trp biosynthesis-associated membrane protein [Streptosporangiaceae bacterium]|nr:Trp biosynthesis-associated membrane protein [Streptosporangiaceae bacterium]MBV9853349.1 Trp biosynthesis-associated membrane protein [Streptosporangiaceae bacterium]
MSRREFGAVLVAGAAGAALILLAVRQRWARAVFTPPQPLPAQVVAVTGQDLVPLTGALALAALACLAAVIATRGVARRAAGVLLAAFGAGAAVAAGGSLSAATVVSVAASRVGSPSAAAVSGAAGSTTAGTPSGGTVVISGSAGHAILTGAPWQAAVFAGALAIAGAGAATAWRGTRWPVMSARFERPGASRRSHGPVSGAAPSGPSAPARDSAVIWESLSSGADPTEESLQARKP